MFSFQMINVLLISKLLHSTHI